jgi:hypothetical protein
MPDHRLMTESEYWRNYHFVLDDVNTAIESFYTDLEIHSCAREDRDVYQMLNKHAGFWNILLYGLQSTFFITLGRIFDDGEDCHSVQMLLAATVAHPEFFSKQALALRRSTGLVNPEWLDANFDSVFEPQSSDLRTLRRALVRYERIYKPRYRNIRTQVYAHKILTEEKLVSDLFSQTQIKEIDEILYFLHDLVEALGDLFQNGRKPELGIKTYDYRQRIKNTTRSVLQNVALHPKEEA